jgi:hypothetical protein
MHCGADQDKTAVFQIRHQHILLGFIETVYLVYKNDGALAWFFFLSRALDSA